MGKREGEEKEYPLYDNLRYAFSLLVRKGGRDSILICATDVLLGILLPFASMALPGVVVACLETAVREPVRIFLPVVYVGIWQIVRLAQGFAGELRHRKLFLLRLDCGTDFFHRCLSVDGQFLESARGQKKLAAAAENLYSGTERGLEVYLEAVLSLLMNLGGLLVYGIILAGEHPLLLVFLTLQAAPVIGMNMRAKKRSFRLAGENDRNWDTFWYLRRESISPSNGKDIRLYRLDRWFLRAFEEVTERFVKGRVREKEGFVAAGMVEKSLSFLRDVVIYGYLIHRMSEGLLSVPVFLLYVGATAGFGGWMSGAFTSLQGVLQNDPVLSRYRAFMEGEGSVEAKKADVSERAGLTHEIRLENVSFRYEGNEEDTIHEMNLTIRPGEKIALVGRNGAGKTTLVKLLCGLYHPDKGKIYLDGQDMQTLSPECLFREFGVVFQDVFAFSFTLEENVSCKRQDGTDRSLVEESLRRAGLLERVKRLPKKSATVLNRDLDPEGVTLSGGEMQKLMLARALYKDAPVVILDEPMAALDPLAESEMYEKYEELIREKTGIFISHRLSSTRFCDRILFLDNGRIREEGSHEELMKKQGSYAELFETQARYYREEKVHE